MRRSLFFAFIGLGGAAILIALGVWQMQRLAWKEGVLAQIESRINDAPIALPATLDPATDAYLPIQTQGTLDRGFIPTGAPDAPLPTGAITVTGNLQWPQEIDGYTPAPDLENNIWFARDVPAMAEALNTEPVLIVARDITPDEATVTPFPVDTSRIPNDHLQYAITWFSLAAIWLAMSALFLRRRRAAPS